MQKLIQGHTHLLGLLRHKNHSSAHPKTITEHSEREERGEKQTAVVMLHFTLQSKCVPKTCRPCKIYQQNTENSVFFPLSDHECNNPVNVGERNFEDTCSGFSLTSWGADHHHPARRASFGVPPSCVPFSPPPLPPFSPLLFACSTLPPCYKSGWQQSWWEECVMGERGGGHLRLKC